MLVLDYILKVKGISSKINLKWSVVYKGNNWNVGKFFVVNMGCFS